MSANEKKIQGKSDKQPKGTPRRSRPSQPGAADPPNVNPTPSQSEQKPTAERPDGGKKRGDTREAGGSIEQRPTADGRNRRKSRPDTSETGGKIEQRPTTDRSDGGKRRLDAPGTGGKVEQGPTTGSSDGGKRRRDTKEAGGNIPVNAGGLGKPVKSQPTQKKTAPPTDKSTPVESDEDIRPQESTEDTLMQTNDEHVIPVLKKKKPDNALFAVSVKKDKSKRNEKPRAKSVTFEKEPHAGSAMIPTKLVTTKPETKTGFKEMSFKDFSVIIGFWFMRFFVPWVDAWHNFNFYLLREPSFWDPLDKYRQIREAILFSVMCIITVSLSVVADLVNFKFYIFSALLLLFVVCPITGAVLNDALVARSYNQDFYHKWSFVSDTLFHGTLAIAFVSFPIQLSCMFSHKEDMSRQAHYNWTAALVFLESINRYIAFWLIPGKCPTKTFTQTAIWFLIGTSIFTVFLLTTNFFFDWAKPEIMRSNRFLRETIKYNKESEVDIKTKRQKFIWFSSTLLLLIITSFVFASLDKLRPHEEWDKHYILSATSMFYLGQILGAVFMVSALLVVRWKLQYYHHLPFLRPDVLVLGLPHFINFIAVVALLGRFATLSQLKEGDVIIGPIPENKKMVVEFYNFEYRNRTVCVHSTSFRPLKIGPRERGTREIYDLGLPRIRFSVTLDPQTTPGLMAVDSFQYKEGTLATFLITLPFSNIRYSDVQALYSKPEIVRVEGTQKLRPKKSPQVSIMNTYVTNNQGPNKWMFYVKHSDIFIYHFLYMLKWETAIKEVPPGPLEIGFHLVNSTLPPQIVRTTVAADNYGVWSVLLGHARPMKKEETFPTRMIKAFSTMEVAGPNSGRLPSKEQLQRDWSVMASMTLAGMASSGVFIGMIYLFWIDSPFIAYRTTCIGVFWVLMNTPAELFKIQSVPYQHDPDKLVDIDVIVISVLAFLQIVCTVLHFITAAQLYAPKFNFRNLPH